MSTRKNAGYSVRTLSVGETYELRRRVLRNNDQGAKVHINEDDRSDAWHLGAVSGETVVATASFYPIACRVRPGVAPSIQLRFMAVDPGFQESGVGRAVIDAALERCRQDRVGVLWANARDTALGFYVRMGFSTVGESFIEPVTGLAHTVVVKDLVSPR